MSIGYLSECFSRQFWRCLWRRPWILRTGKFRNN